MSKLRVTDRTTLRHLQDFVGGLDSGVQVRAKLKKDASVELYTKAANNNWSNGKRATNREERFNCARLAVAAVMQREAPGVRVRESCFAPQARGWQNAVPLTARDIRDALALTRHIDELTSGGARTSRAFSEMAENAARGSVPVVDRLVPSAWIHGTTAIGEILLSGEVWGGHAGIKLAGAEAKGVAEDAQQEHHFHVARTAANGATRSPGHAYIQARKDAASRLDHHSPLPSWTHGGRPLIGVLEFTPEMAERTERFHEKTGAHGVVETARNAEGNYSRPLTGPMKPTAIRLVSLEDAVRVIDYLQSHLPPRANLLDHLPAQIRVRAQPEWDGSRPDHLISDTGEFRDLMVAPRGWLTYNTSDIVAAMGL